ncbi:hypothetical protein KKE45_00390 [Patescibacteria group bacterium]|nr:hypothetical protein [Patescibacteria group bacterium]
MSLNLLPNAAKFQAEKIKVKKVVRLLVVGVLFVEVLLLLVVFVWSLALNNVFLKNDRRYKNSLLAYETLSDRVLMNYRIKQDVGMLDEVFGSRFEYSEVFGKVKNLFSSKVDLRSFKLINGKKGFVLEGAVAGFESVDEIEIIVQRIKEGKDKDFGSAELTGLSVADDYWEFKMEVLLR